MAHPIYRHYLGLRVMDDQVAVFFDELDGDRGMYVISTIQYWVGRREEPNEERQWLDTYYIYEQPTGPVSLDDMEGFLYDHRWPDDLCRDPTETYETLQDALLAVYGYAGAKEARNKLKRDVLEADLLDTWPDTTTIDERGE